MPRFVLVGPLFCNVHHNAPASALYAWQQRLEPGNRSTDALQEQLLPMRSEGKVKFDINTGGWNKA